MRIPVTAFSAPAEGESIPLFYHPAPEALRADFSAMRLAQTRWKARPLVDRIAVLRRCRHAMAASARPLADVARSGTSGGSTAEALSAQVLPLLDAGRFIEREAGSILATRRLGAKGKPVWLAGAQAEVRREPLGLVLVIAPSNYPLFLPGVTLLQALAAGNAVILKPGRGGTQAALAMVAFLQSAGIDEDLVKVLPEPPEAASAAIRTGVDKVVFIGSVSVGQRLLRQLGATVTPSIMELSGCDAVFVRADADLDLAVKALAFGLRLNGSATCIAPRRVFVHETVADELVVRLHKTLADEAPVHFPVSAQDRILPALCEALDEGGQLLHGRISPADGIVGPVVLMRAKAGMRLLQEDLFSPVLSLVEVADDREALQEAAKCPFALGASVFTADERAGRNLALHIQAGVVVINDLIVPTADPRLPFGGRKRSGFGVTRGAEGLLELTVPKVVTVRSGAWRPHLAPEQTGDAELFAAYIEITHATGLRRRLAALGRFIRALRFRSLSSTQATSTSKGIL